MSSSQPHRSVELDRSAQARVEAAKNRLPLLEIMHAKGSLTLRQLAAAYREIAFAARDSGLRGDTLRAILTEYRDHTKSLLASRRNAQSAGNVGLDDVQDAEAALAEAEYWLAQANDEP